MDYKNTIITPKTDFPMKAGLPAREPGMLKAWQDMELYSAMLEKNKELPPFVLHDGPPFSNGYIHMGHALNKTLKPGGALLAGLDNGVNFWFDENEERIAYTMPFNPLLNPEQMALLQKTDCGVQFSHTIEEQIGGQLKAGLLLTDIFEDTNGSGNLHAHNLPCFWATRAVKPEK